ncbi:MAG: 2Fe-2S iron-sulfur cluster-binding protein [Treponemataceae bacterium]
MVIKINLNGTDIQFDAEPNTRLLEILRSKFLLTSVKCSCLQGFCGACTVLLDDIPVPSCMVPICNINGSRIITLEYFSQAYENDYKKIIATFKKANVKMCGFCNGGKIFTAYKIMQMKESVDETKIKEMFQSQLCRCSVADSLVLAMKKLT